MLSAGHVVAGRFRIVRFLAEGGMGRVYVAEQMLGATARTVALKMMLPDASADLALVARFSRECVLLTELEHPNTVKVHDFGHTEDGELFVAMELVRGESLGAALAREGSFPPDRVDGIVAQLAGSLDEAHRKGIIHRDLKPENVLLAQHAGAPDFVKVLDFGIAKRAEEAGGPAGASPTERGAVLGSLGYMSPEQLVGAPLDARADVYALGLLTYEMLVGRPPFVSASTLELVTLHLSAAPSPFDATPAGAAVPEAMRRAVLRALAKSPGDRPSTALAFHEELRAANPGARGSRMPAAPPPVALRDDAAPPARGRVPTLIDAPVLSSGGPWMVGQSAASSPPSALAAPSSPRHLALAVLLGVIVAAALMAMGMWLHHSLEENHENKDPSGPPRDAAAAVPPARG
jgi:serine/threonine protein kinase